MISPTHSLKSSWTSKNTVPTSDQDSQMDGCARYTRKKDPTDISNYHPITLLNTDYKLLTKVLAIQLMDPIHHLIHPNQAGFIPKRSIFDHIRLAKAIINYAEVMEENRTIIALDQEKVYDKIRHNYLWETLNAFGLPHLFTKTVKSLYQHTHTQVAINGVLSHLPSHVRHTPRRPAIMPPL